MTLSNGTASLADKVPHSNRVEEGSINIEPAILPKTTVPEGTDALVVAVDIINNFSKHLTAKDYDGVASLFSADGAWRDHLGLSWDFHTLQGPAKIAAFLKDGQSSSLKTVAVDEVTLSRQPAVTNLDAFGITRVVQFFVDFTTDVGQGQGVGRAIYEEGGSWKLISFYTVLRKLKGVDEPIGPHRPIGASHGGGRNMKNWLEQRQEDENFEKSDPVVFVIGAGQGGLTSAARLKMLGVPTLVIDRENRVGDNWRNRYRQLVLHDVIWFDHLPYLEFPPFWPVFTPKDKLGDFFEAYVKLLELNVWTQTEIVSLRYDAAQKRYDVTVERTKADGTTKETRTFHPRHIIQATGHSGKKNLPDIKGLDAFQGRACHSSEFPGAVPQPDNATVKRRAIVVGSCNSGHDIAQDYYENGYDVTMVQRSSTCVVSSAAIEEIAMAGLYSEAVQAKLPVDDADLLNWSTSSAVAKTVQAQITTLSIQKDAELLANLEKAGFQLDRGNDGAGLLFKYFQRGGGYYIDVGCSQLIIEGKIKIKSGQEITEAAADGLVFADGSKLLADEIVFATGYQNMRTQTRVLFGDELADACHDVWGFDQEGEFRTMWRRSGQPGYWFMGGNLALSRYFSHLLALQIKAQEEGLASY